MKDSIEITRCDVYSEHGEQVIHNLIADGGMPGTYKWPKPNITAENWQNQQIILAKVNGAVAGRAVLSSGYYPFAELENLFVDPAHRGHGIGSRIVEFAIKRSAETGYLAIHLQTELDNRKAQHLYTSNGFLPSIQGQLLRMMQFLFYPALSKFKMDHPLALLQSQSGASNHWELRWQDPVSRDKLITLLSGGSSQADSNGYGPGVAGFEIRDQDAAYFANVSGPSEVYKGSEFAVCVKLRNNASIPIIGACRLLLNAGFKLAGDYAGSEIVTVDPGGEQEISLSLRSLESFDSEIMKYLTYRSAAVVVEFQIDRRVFWLSHEVIVKAR